MEKILCTVQTQLSPMQTEQTAPTGPQWSGWNDRVRLQPHLLPATFNAYCPHSLPVHSGPPMCSGLCSLPKSLRLRLFGLYRGGYKGLGQG